MSDRPIELRVDPCSTCNGSKTVPFESFLAAGTVACPACEVLPSSDQQGTNHE